MRGAQHLSSLVQCSAYSLARCASCSSSRCSRASSSMRRSSSLSIILVELKCAAASLRTRTHIRTRKTHRGSSVERCDAAGRVATTAEAGQGETPWAQAIWMRDRPSPLLCTLFSIPHEEERPGADFTAVGEALSE